MNPTAYLFLTSVLFGAELLYLRIARHCRIIDIPNERSSHAGLSTIRGGGILFWVAALGAFAVSNFVTPYFFLGLTLVAAISFWDDLRPVPSRYRLAVQGLAVLILSLETRLFPLEIGLGLVFLMMSVGVLNAYNFMDGINGMTAFYSLVTIGTLWYWHQQTPIGNADSLLVYTSIALLVFAWFNARRQAICFAGDVGSVSIAFIVLYLILKVIHQYQTFLPGLLLALYGVDTVLTVGHRLWLRQPVFRAHRLHLFQLLVHRLGWPHLRVSAMYALIQLTINGLVVIAVRWSITAQWLLAGIILTILTSAYGCVKIYLMRSSLPKTGATP